MLTPKQLMESGDLKGSIEQLTLEVRSAPTDAKRRAFLFELLCFAGDWARAVKQAAVLGESPDSAVWAQLGQQNIAAEKQRERLFSVGERPGTLAPLPARLDLHLEAIDHIRFGRFVQARTALDRAEDERPPLPGTVDGTDFDDFRDFDDVVASVFELFADGRYVWLPTEQVRRLEIPKPEKLRDLVWSRARIELVTGQTLEAFMPCLYAGSPRHPDDLVRLGRMTDWRDMGGELQLGAGQRTFLADGEEKPILEVRVVELAGE